MIEKERGKLPPGCSGTPIRKIGYFGWKTWELHFDNCRIPATTMLGGEGRGFYTMMALLEDRAGAYRGTRDRAGARRARRFGHVRAAPLAVQAADRRVPGDPLQAGRDGGEYRGGAPADVFVATEVDSKTALRQRGLDGEVVRLRDGRAGHAATRCKFTAAMAIPRILPIERYWRDARLTKIFEGTSQIQLRIISDRLLGGMPE